MEEMNLVNTINDLAAKQKELGFVDNDTSRSKWHVGKPEKDGSYIVVTIYKDDHDDKVKSMYLADWRVKAGIVSLMRILFYVGLMRLKCQLFLFLLTIRRLLFKEIK